LPRMRLDRGCDRCPSFLPRLSARLISINGTGAISGSNQINVRNLESIIEAARRMVVAYRHGLTRPQRHLLLSDAANDVIVTL
jgi:hypothetical protein